MVAFLKAESVRRNADAFTLVCVGDLRTHDTGAATPRLLVGW